MRLKVLKLTNFRGIKSLKLEFGDGNAVIYGANGTGKTTVANAVAWLLTGKSVTGEKNFTPKTCGVHKKDHIAEATFVINEAGDERTFKKVFHEKWKKPRGKVAVLTGHETVMYVDGEKVNEATYVDRLANALSAVAPPPLESLLIAGHFTETLGVKERRQILFDGFATDKSHNIISKPEWAELKEGLAKTGCTPEEYRKRAESMRREIQSDVDYIPKQIALLESTKLNVFSGHPEAVESEIAELEAKLHNLLSGRNDEAQNAYNQAFKKKAEKERWLTITDNELGKLQWKQEELRKSFHEVTSQKWDETGGICPTCHRPLPEDEVENLKKAFEADNASLKAEVIREGKEIGEKIKNLLTEKELAEKELAVLTEEVSKAEAKLNEKPDDNGEEIQAINEELTKKRDYLSSLKANANLEEKIASLKESQKTMVKSLEKAEKAVYMADNFLLERAKQVEEEINSNFTYIKFKLFEQQVNGGLKDVCEPVIPNADGMLVDYKSANTAAQVNANLEIMQVLSESYGVTVPIFIDGAERVSNLRDTESKTPCQRIALVVSAKDKELRIEQSI